MSAEKGMRPLDNEAEARLLEDEELEGIAGGDSGEHAVNTSVDEPATQDMQDIRLNNNTTIVVC